MKISIITATFNSSATLGDTLESILRQTYQNYECVIKDGGSKDGTLEVARSYEARFGGRLKIISEPDAGLYDAMNKGIEAATGDVVGILNSDDFYTFDDVLETVAAEFARDAALDAVYGDIHYVKEDDVTRRTRYYSSRHFAPARMRMGYMPAHPSFYVRRECYAEFGTFNTSYKVAADFENLLRLIYLGKIRTSYVPKDFVTMREGGMSSSGFKSKLQIMKDHFRAFEENGVKYSKALYMCRYIDKIYDMIKK